MRIVKTCINSLLFIFILLSFNPISLSQSQQKSIDSPRIDSFYFTSEALFKCNIKLPREYNPDVSHTLVIGLHGGGGTPESFIKVWDDIENVNFIYATPQGPYSILFDKLGNEWSLWSSPDFMIREKAAELIGDYIADLIKILKGQYIISDVYLLGFSQGAVFTYIAGMKYYRLYKGLIILSGPGIFEPLGAEQFAPMWLEEKYLEPAKALKIFISHGIKDQAAKFDLGVKSKDILIGYGYDVTFKPFNDGHTIRREVLDNILEWVNE